MAIKKKMSDNRCRWGCGEREPFCSAGGNVNWCSHYRKQYTGSLKNKKVEAPSNPIKSYLWEYSQRKQKEYIWKKNLNPHVHSSLIYNSQDMEAI